MAEMERPPNTLSITVVRGMDLLAHDSSGYSDPYVSIRVMDGDKKLKKRTKYKRKTLDPEWNETLNFEVSSNKPGIHFKVQDHNRFSRNSPLGDAFLDVTMLEPNGTEKALSVQLEAGEYEHLQDALDLGHITIRARWLCPVLAAEAERERKRAEAKRREDAWIRRETGRAEAPEAGGTAAGGRGGGRVVTNGQAKNGKADRRGTSESAPQPQKQNSRITPLDFLDGDSGDDPVGSGSKTLFVTDGGDLDTDSDAEAVGVDDNVPPQATRSTRRGSVVKEIVLPTEDIKESWKEYRVIKTNQKGKRQARILSVDARFIYNKPRAGKKVMSKLVWRRRRKISDVQKLTVDESNESFTIYLADGTTRDYACESVKELREIVSKVQMAQKKALMQSGNS